MRLRAHWPHKRAAALPHAPPPAVHDASPVEEVPWDPAWDAPVQVTREMEERRELHDQIWEMLRAG